LKSLFGLDLVEVIPNAVSLENLGRGDAREFALPTGRRLLYLTYYYSHKNIEILIPVARLIREKGLDFKIVVTLDPRQGPGAAAFLEAISREGLDGIVVNVGLVEMRHVPSLYRQCQGLLMPTLLESFSGTYVEAMFHELAVFTSDLDFARAVCGECAWYFNPLDAGDILQTVVAGFSRDEEFKTRVRKGKLRVGAMPDWPQAFGKYQALLDRIAGSSG
jgi:glycosyltransferase involved in cell wall biosynthesis